MQAEITANFAASAEALDATSTTSNGAPTRIAAVGQAFEAENFDGALYDTDGGHQSMLGGTVATNLCV